MNTCESGGIGRHAGFRVQSMQIGAGSSPASRILVELIILGALFNPPFPHAVNAVFD